ncbi:hypothetical protein LCGC14_1807500 [marine sediment metagenome]|uniref:Uncharacterized protein n=1 Tax=marine sediment metagenome TaxID=412755 RepID=A0A0F9GMX0_9ZZZZ
MKFLGGIGLWLGVWVMFIGGIIQIVNSVTPVVIASGIAWGLVKIMAASLIGVLSAAIFIAPGVLLIEDVGGYV